MATFAALYTDAIDTELGTNDSQVLFTTARRKHASDAWPVLSALDSADLGLSEAIVGGNRLLGSWVGADVTHLILRKLPAAIRHSALVALTVLGFLVAHVVVVGAEEQVLRTHAQRVIATVTDASAVMSGSGWDGAVGQNPSDSMRFLHPTVKTELAITGVVDASGPEPALAGAVNLLPESFLYALTSHATSYGQVVRGAYGTPLPARLAYFTISGAA